MSSSPGTLEREARIVRHARAGMRCALSDAVYRTRVLLRLEPMLVGAPDDLFAAQPWLWAIALGAERSVTGALAVPIAAGAGLLREWLATDESSLVVLPRWSATTGGALDLASTLRSHPFADIVAWSIRTPSAAWCSMPRGS